MELCRTSASVGPEPGAGPPAGPAPAPGASTLLGARDTELAPRWGLSPEPHPYPLAGPAPAPGACTLLAARRTGGLRRPSSLQPFVFLVSRVLAAPARRAETGSRFRFHSTPAETPPCSGGPGGRLLVRATRVHRVTAPRPHGPRGAAGSNDGARFVPETSAVAGDPGDRRMNRKHPEPAVETMARLSAGVGLTEGGAGRLRGRARAAGPRAGVAPRGSQRGAAREARALATRRGLVALAVCPARPHLFVPLCPASRLVSAAAGWGGRARPREAVGVGGKGAQGGGGWGGRRRPRSMRRTLEHGE